MNKNYPFEELRSSLDPVQRVDLFLPVNPKFDQVAACLALKLSLEKKGKTVSVISPSPMVVEYSQLVGLDMVREKSETGNDLVVSFNYPLDQIEKVSYNDDGGKLNLVIQVKEGASRVEKTQLTYQYQGGGVSLQIAVGIENPGRAGQVGNQINFNEAVNLDNSSGNSRFGRINLVDPEASSCSEIVTAVISVLSLGYDQDIASNLYLGLKEVTNNFSSENVGADTFEAAAICLRWGAKKAVGGKFQKPVFEKTLPASEIKNSRPFPTGKPAAIIPKQNESKKPSSDWLEPKIFKSSNIS